MMYFLLCLLAVGAEVSATTPSKSPPGFPVPSVPHYQCGPNQEYLKCGSACAPSCASLVVSAPSCTTQCVEGCFCKQGYYRDNRGNCVTRDQCSLSVCPRPNEVAKECGSCEKTCANYKRTDISCAAVCVRGCFCRDGYVRNAYGICVMPQQCPREPVCLKPNEEYQSCGSSCPDTCDNYRDTGRICTTNCVAGCHCKKGYVRNMKDNTCIRPQQCPLSVCPRPNEVAKECGSLCEKTCANYKRTDISCAAVCVRGCFCRDGYVRNAYGICVLPQQCPREPVCFQANEEYQSCGSSCPDTCDNYRDTGRICTTNCVAGCHCKKGYVRNMKDNTCIRPQQCPLSVCHRPNEVAKECGSPCEKTCANYKRTDISCAAVCVRGCFCRDGYVRNAYGICVLPQQCPSPTCRANESYSTCGSACPATCRNRGDTCQVCTAQCVKGCFCNKGLVRADDGTCIAPKDCPRRTCSDPNEVFSECPPTCPPTDKCSELWTKYDCSKFPKCCKPQCRCRPGYARNKKGVCVTTKQCIHGE